MNADNIDDQLREWRRERNAALLALDLAWARNMLPQASSDEVRLVAMHKARYECRDLPAEARHESRRWLQARGYGRSTREPFLPDDQLPE